MVRAIAGGVSCFSCGHLALDEDLYHTDPETAAATQLCRLCYEALCNRALRPPAGSLARNGDEAREQAVESKRAQVKKHQVYHTMIDSQGPKRQRGMW